MEYKLEKVSADKYAVLNKSNVFIFFTRWIYVKNSDTNVIRHFATKRAAQAYINYKTNPKMNDKKKIVS
jgi:hypothetical protein